ncbi:hypothetical protein AL064_12540 [Pseudomonas syringae pv. syringae]|uniref:hypothetical protein n=1 Tax=Pseudomonas syringae TaxID=317 RepID=UPI000760532A|nr:hypothetical protein [Pseudomonas syringae]KWS11027.1 hypothetical protein AL064_12540 [Pseudomonas syringae pv. syringae]
MSGETEVLKQLLQNDHLHNEDAKVSGIAQLAVDKGFDSLSALQQSVIARLLTKKCEGVTNPGGHHNECHVILEGQEFATALEQERYYESVLCENCINETEQYSREWERLESE